MGNNIIYRLISTPLGEMTAGVYVDHLVLFEFGNANRVKNSKDNLSRHLDALYKKGNHPILDETQVQIDQYFKGERKSFDLPLKTFGTDFEKKTWAKLLEIPYGKTWSYGELATKLQNSKAVRAVGRANGRNKIAIIIPCHRVIGADGKLTGYGGGLHNKVKLLELENAKFRKEDLNDNHQTSLNQFIN